MVDHVSLLTDQNSDDDLQLLAEPDPAEAVLHLKDGRQCASRCLVSYTDRCRNTVLRPEYLPRAVSMVRKLSLRVCYYRLEHSSITIAQMLHITQRLLGKPSPDSSFLGSSSSRLFQHHSICAYVSGSSSLFCLRSKEVEVIVVMPSLYDARLKHARHYTQVAQTC